VDVEKYQSWAKKAFPERIPLYSTSIDDMFQCHSYRRGYVNHEDIGIYLAIFEFCLEKGQSLQDRGIPHVRVFGLWKKLYQTDKVGRSVSDLKIKVIRETLVGRQIIQITDRRYCPATHISMKYAYGKFFPGKKLYREKKAPSWQIVLHPWNHKSFLLVHRTDNREGNTPNTVPTHGRSILTPMTCPVQMAAFWDTS
jgi:hypothetical protein